MCMYIHLYIYIYMCTYRERDTYMYIYIYIVHTYIHYYLEIVIYTGGLWRLSSIPSIETIITGKPSLPGAHRAVTAAEPTPNLERMKRGGTKRGK